MVREVALAAAVLPLAFSLAPAQRRTAPPTAADSATYAALVARVRAGDTTVADITRLRLLYAELAPAAPSGPTPAELFARARQTSDSLVARALIDSVVDTYYGHIQAHVDAERRYRQRGDSTRARREGAIVRAFIASIGASGGRTPETAMPVTSLAEESAFLAARGVRFEEQALLRCGTGHCDAITGTDASGARVTYYFRLVWWD